MDNNQHIEPIPPTSATTPEQNVSVPPPAPSPVMPDVPKPKSKFLPALIIFLVLIALGAIGYFAYQRFLIFPKTAYINPSKNATNMPLVTPEPQNTEGDIAGTPIPSTNPALTENWKTFVYEPMGYSFKYPPTWFDAQCEGGVHLYTKLTQRPDTSCQTPPFGVVYLNFSEKPIEIGYLKSTDYVLEKEQKIYTPFGLATKQVIKQVNEAPGPKNYIGITFKGSNEFYYLISTEDLQYETVVEQILSTFKFTE